MAGKKLAVIRAAIQFGVFVNGIGEQLRLQDLEADPKDVKQWQRAAEAVLYLHLHGYSTQQSTRRAREQIAKDILSSARPRRKTKAPPAQPKE